VTPQAAAAGACRPSASSRLPATALLLARLVALCVLGACHGEVESAATSSAALASLLGSESLEAVRSPDRVESLPVEDVGGSKDSAAIRLATDLPGDFRILPQPLPVPPELAAKLSVLLLSPQSYPPVISFCMFDPGVALRFWKGNSAVDVLVCFHCNDLAFEPVGAPKSLGGKHSFAPIRGPLLQLVQAARPHDERLQSLK
jgi:hypothetical protein